jgi:hypothetical protein
MSAIRRHFHPRTAFLLFIALVAINPLHVHAAATATTTTVAITSSTGTVTSVPSGTAVTLTATVKAGSALVEAGLVKFCDAAVAHCTDIHLKGTGQLTSTGKAALKFVPGPGTHSYKAEFVGTSSDAASSSAASSLTVIGPTTSAIAQSGNPGNYTLTATVTATGATGPTGKVSFLDTSNGNAVLGTATLGTATGKFAWTTPQSPSTAPEPQSITVADFNGDGIPDLAIGTNGTTGTKNIGSISLLLGKGDGTFQAAKTFTGLTGNQVIIAALFVPGGPVDVIATNNANTTTDNGLFFTGDGKGGLSTGTPLSLGIDIVSAIITGDFNGDGKQDFIVGGAAFGVPAFNVFLGNGDGTFNNGTLNATSDVAITALAAGDFTGEGYLDLAVAHSDGTVDIFLQDGEGDFYPNAGTQAGSSPSAIAIGDFNGDGKADLAIANSAGDNVSVLLGDGTGDFNAAASPATGTAPAAIAVGDFNGDGLADLAVANSSSKNVTILLGKGDGTFTTQTPLNVGDTPVSLATGTFSGNGTSDIAVANEDPSSQASSSTATILLSQLTQTAAATATGIAPVGAGTHLVDASYPGDSNHAASVSTTTSLTGTGSQGPVVTLSPTSLTFPSTKVGSVSATQTVTVTNTGSATLNISGINASGTDAPSFYVPSRTCGTTLAANASCTLSVGFRPKASGTLSGTISIADNAGNSPQAIAVQGTGIASPVVTFSSGSITFPSTDVGATSATQVVTLTNTGDATLTVKYIISKGTDAGSFFDPSNTCGTSVAAGASCTINIAFRPKAAGALTDTIYVNDNAAGGEQGVNVSGTGIAEPLVTLSPSSLTFPSTSVGSTSAAQTVTLKNTGFAVLDISYFSTTGTDATSFAVPSKTCGSTLAVNASCTFNVTFKPQATGALAGDVAIHDNAVNSPQGLKVSGTGK